MTKAAPLHFKGDYGAHPLDGYAQDGAAKASFRKEGTALLERLRILLGAEPSFAQGRKQVRAVSWNPAGPGSSGDISASLFAPGEDAGVYVVLGCVNIASVRASPSGVTLMWRLTTKGNPFGGNLNRWENFDVNLEDLSNRIEHALKVRTLPGDKNAVIACTSTSQSKPIAPNEPNSEPLTPHLLRPAPLEQHSDLARLSTLEQQLDLEPTEVTTPSPQPSYQAVQKPAYLEPRPPTPSEPNQNQAHPAAWLTTTPPPTLPPGHDPYALL